MLDTNNGDADFLDLGEDDVIETVDKGVKGDTKGGKPASGKTPRKARPRPKKPVKDEATVEAMMSADRSEKAVQGLDMQMLTAGPLEYPETVPLQDEEDEKYAQLLATGMPINDAWVQMGGTDGSYQAHRRAGSETVLRRVAYLQMVGAMLVAADENWVAAQFLRISREYRTAGSKDQRDMLRGERESLNDFGKVRGLFVTKSEATVTEANPVDALKGLRSEVSERTWEAITSVMELARDDMAANRAQKVKDVEKAKRLLGDDLE